MKEETLKIISTMAQVCKDETREYLYKTVLLEIIDNKLYAIVTDGYMLIKKEIDDIDLFLLVEQNSDKDQIFDKSLSVRFDRIFNCTQKERINKIMVEIDGDTIKTSLGYFSINRREYPNYKSIIPIEAHAKINNDLYFSISLFHKITSTLKNIYIHDKKSGISIVGHGKNKPVKIYYSDNREEFAIILPLIK